MALAFRNNALVRFAAGLAAKCLCCQPPKCNAGTDECGNEVRACGPFGPTTVGECTPECVPPTEPSACGPDCPCPTCYECVDLKCVRIEDCCEDGTPCPECQTCINGSCRPCGECQKCEGGACRLCDPCEACIDGVCVPCPELCIGGICVPRQYYCCYDSPASPGNPTPTTTCRQATLAAFGQTNPCEHGAHSGPHNSSLLCQQACSRFKCVPDACGTNRCVRDPNGPYDNYAACAQACGDPCDMPCSFAGANAPGIYPIDGCQREICVSYCSTNSRPIRVQIWGPIMVNGCPQPGTRVIKTDSDWRGDDCCDCPDARNGGSLQGGPKGQITWNKPRGVISFEVAVLTACGAEYTIDIRGCAACDEQAEPAPCDCEVDGDCAEDCFCCNGECVPNDDPDCGGCCVVVDGKSMNLDLRAGGNTCGFGESRVPACNDCDIWGPSASYFQHYAQRATYWKLTAVRIFGWNGTQYFGTVFVIKQSYGPGCSLQGQSQSTWDWTGGGTEQSGCPTSFTLGALTSGDGSNGPPDVHFARCNPAP